MYIHNLPDWPALVAAFKNAGYTINIDLSNEPYIQRIEDGE